MASPAPAGWGPCTSSATPSWDGEWLSLPERLRVFLRIAEAVAFAHAHGVLHRDLKPQNVMIGPFGEVLVLDWGLAKVLSDPSPARPGGSYLR